MTSKQPNNATRRGESGNVLYIVLLGVVLFAALTLVFSKGARQGLGNLSQKQAELDADDILSFAQQIQHAVDHVYSNNCSEDQINFDQGWVSGYANAGAPADKHCNVFDLAGGAITFRSTPESVNDGSAWIFTGDNNVRSSTFGTTATDLVLILKSVDIKACGQINRELHIDGTPGIIGTFTSVPFTGAYGNGTNEIGSGDGARAECIQDGAVGDFYYTLMER